MVNMTVYVDDDALCTIVNTLNEAFIFENGDSPNLFMKNVSLKRTRKFPYEVQVPIQIIGDFTKKNRTTIDLCKLQEIM